MLLWHLGDFEASVVKKHDAKSHSVIAIWRLCYSYDDGCSYNECRDDVEHRIGVCSDF